MTKQLRALSIRALVLLFVFCLGLPVVWGQFTSGVEGTVGDPSHAVLPGATLKLTNTETGIGWTTQSSATGYYRFTALPSAVFRLSVSAPGFKTVDLGELRVQVSETRTVNVTLEIGASATVVNVTGEAMPVETSEGRVSGLIDSQKIKDLPVAGRNFYGLVVLTPGVTGLPTGGSQAYAQATADVFSPEYGVNLNANGLRAESNAFSVDSGSVTSMVRHGVANTIPNSESVQELRVLVNNFDAQNGGSAGALVSVVTKQGSNVFHGSAAFFHTDNHLQARNTFQSVVPVFRRNEGVASIGGPIFKNKTFFFFSIDLQRAGVAPGNVATVFTPAFITWMTQNKPNNISTGVVKSYLPQVTPTANFKTAAGLLEPGCTPGNSITTVAGSMPCDLQVLGDGTFTATIPRNGLQTQGRVDHVFRDADRLFVNFFRTVLNDTNGSSIYPAFRSPRTQYTIQANLTYTHTFSPNLLNEAGVSFVRLDGLNNCLTCQVPSISITGGAANLGSGGPTFFVQNNYEYRNILSWVKGAHSMKMGASLSMLQSNFNPVPGFTRANYTFNNVFDFANDDPFSQGNIGINPSTGTRYVPAVAERQRMVGAFFQDNWKVKPNFTIGMGLRWETFGKIPEATQVTNVVFQGGGTDINALIANAKTDIVPTIYTKANLHNFGPRISLAWDPTKKGKMSIRAGAGIFYDVHASQVYGGSHFNPPLYAIVTANKQTAPVLPVFGLGNATEPFNFPRSSLITPAMDSKNGLLFAKAGVTWVDPTSPDAYSENFFFGIQYSLSSSWVAEANYIGSEGHKLFAQISVNRFPGDLIVNNGTFTGLNHSYGAISYVRSLLSSSYNGGNISVRKRPTHGVTISAAYTFGKALDYASSFSNAPMADPNNYRLNRGLADFNVGQKLALSVIYELPQLRSSAAPLRQAFGGWQISGVTILQNGTPFRVFCSRPFAAVKDASGKIVGNSGCDYNADGFNNDVPMTPSFGNNLGPLTRTNYHDGLFTASQFPAPPLGQQGNLGRNVFNGPGFANTDLSVFKTFRFKWLGTQEGASLQMRFEAFNAFNRVNLGQVNADMASAVFGKSTTAFGARDFQFGARFSF